MDRRMTRVGKLSWVGGSGCFGYLIGVCGYESICWVVKVILCFRSARRTDHDLPLFRTDEFNIIEISCDERIQSSLEVN